MPRALISVSDKRGVIEVARAFAAHNIEICSTGGTATTLREANVPVTTVESVTGVAEMLDGRVKTLHPASTLDSWRDLTIPRIWRRCASRASRR